MEMLKEMLLIFSSHRAAGLLVYWYRSQACGQLSKIVRVGR